MRRCKGVSRRPKLDIKVRGRLLGENSKARRAVGLAASCGEELVVGRSRDVNQRGAGVDNALGGRGEGGRAVGEASDGDTPVRRRIAAFKRREVGD